MSNFHFCKTCPQQGRRAVLGRKGNNMSGKTPLLSCLCIMDMNITVDICSINEP